MKRLAFNLRLDSPAFAGSVQNGTRSIQVVKKGQTTFEQPAYYPNDPFGLRIPALRGVLELWYRALLGGQRPEAVYQEQGRVFGAAELGQGLRLRYAGRPRFRSGELEAPPRFSKAFLYLGYGPMQTFKVPDPRGGGQGRNKVSSYNHQSFRDAIFESGDGQEGVFRYVAIGTERQLRALRRALILLHLFGGIGSRSRRGWGSVRVEAECIPPAPSPGELADQIQALWRVAAPGTPPEVRPRFSAFGPGCRVFVTPALDGGYGGVLDEFYRRFEATRLYRVSGAVQRSEIAQQDHDLEVRDARGGQLSGAPERLAFGLPYSPSGSDWGITYAQESRLGQGRREASGRRASPLLLKVHRLANGQHAGVALLLNGTFFGAATEKVGAVGKRSTVHPPDYAAIHEFLSPTDRTPSRDELLSWTEVKLPGIQETRP